MKVTGMWRAQKPTVSLEFFPARNAEAAGKLTRVIDQLALMGPDFVSVTFGAGGSTREGSRQLVAHLKNDLKLEVMAYFAGFGLGPDDIQGVLDSYFDLGVDNLLVVRGDPPHGQPDFQPLFAPGERALAALLERSPVGQAIDRRPEPFRDDHADRGGIRGIRILSLGRESQRRGDEREQDQGGGFQHLDHRLSSSEH